jgi:hypothetical protein
VRLFIAPPLIFFLQTALSPRELGEHVLSPLVNGEDGHPFQMRFSIGGALETNVLGKVLSSFSIRTQLTSTPTAAADRARTLRSLFSVGGDNWQVQSTNSTGYQRHLL